MNSRFLEQSKKTRNRMAGLMLAIFVSFTALASVPTPAAAQTDVGQQSRNVLDVVKEGLITGVTSGLIDAANYFVSNMAYQLALSIMGDCPGQKSCWSSKNWNSILRESAEGAAATAITSAADASGLTGMGFDVCNPGLPGINLRFQLGMLAEEKPAGPRCSLSQIGTSWGNMYSSMKDTELKSMLNVSVQPGQSPMSFGLSAFTYKYEKKQEDTRTKYEDWATNKIGAQGFNDVRDPVSGRTMTPGSMVANQMKNADQKKTEGSAQTTQEYSKSAIAAQAVIGIAVTGVRVFVQTLTARAWNKLVKGLLSAEEAVSQDPDIIFNPEAIFNPGIAEVETAIQPQYASVKTRDVGEYDIISEFTTCGTGARGPYNCVMDAELAAAVRMGDAEGLTLAEAFRRKLIADKPLISEKNNPEDNRRADCFRDGYCESNLKKLRAARIVPVGWELAANLSPKKQPVTLKQAMGMFDQCGTGAGDPAYPFCHLVDPNWVLKIPPLQCKAMGYGSTPLDPKLAARAETCVDMQSCLKQNDSGTCENQWGYCTKEERVWRFKAEACPAYYDSCRSLTRTADKAKVNYLTNTMERSVCNADNAGCTEYATDRKVARCQWLAAGGCTPSGSDDSCLCRSNDPANCSCPDLPSTANLSCSVGKGSSSCTTPSGQTCRLGGAAACAGDSCACSIQYSCRVEKGASSCYTTTGDISPTDDWQDSPSRFFSRKAEKCDATNDGCTKLQSLAPGQSLNLIRNGSFEELDDAAGDGTLNHARYWSPMASVPAGINGFVTSDQNKVSSGSHAIYANGGSHESETVSISGICRLEAGCPTTGPVTKGTCIIPFGKTSCKIDNWITQSGIQVQAGKVYTLSASTKPSTSANAGRMSLQFIKGDGSNYGLEAGDVVTMSSLYVTDDGINFRADAGGTCQIESGRLGFAWGGPARAVPSCTFALKAGLPIRFATLTLDSAYSNTDLYYDNVMLEEGNGTMFHEGSSGGDFTYGNVPPANLGCRGEDDDPAVCANYAAVCRENEVGCEKFSPTDGGTPLTGIATANDLCPAECVGYDAFKKQSSLFDGEKFPEYFIPSTARSCPVEEVGCSGFTNLKTEKASFYSRLRSCAPTEDQNQDVYYTWEGSDVTGYQLKTWRFKTTSGQVSSDTCCYGGECMPGACNDANRPSEVPLETWLSQYRSDVSIEGDTANVLAGRAPCTSLGGAEMNECISRDGTEANMLGSMIGYCTRADIDNGDIDCREFYDRDGNRHYRRLDKLVEVTSTCDLYRIQSSTKPDCGRSGGWWDEAKQSCQYRFDSSASQSCSEEAAGCRAYKGGASGDVRFLFNDDLETANPAWSATTLSTESLVVGGHSLKTAAGTVTRQVGTTVQPGLNYTLSFWARGAGTISAALIGGEPITCTMPTPCAGSTSCLCTDDNSGLSCVVDATAGASSTCQIVNTGAMPDAGFAFSTEPAKTTSEWRQYTLGPVSIPSQSMFGYDPVAVRFSIAGESSTFFIDNVSLRENRSDFYVIADSWRTPLSCDQTVDGGTSPQEMIGCREYGNSMNQKAYLRSLSKLCRDRAIGCQAYLDMRNSDSPYAETYNAVCDLGAKCDADLAGGNPNCICSYVSDVATVGDACRVKLGEQTCRFALDGADLNGSNNLYPDRVIVPADRLTYLVVSTGGSCNEKTAGCRTMGVRQTAFEQTCFLAAKSASDMPCELKDPMDGRLLGSCTVKSGNTSCVIPTDQPVTTGWQEKGIIDNPAKYSQTMCNQEALRCEEFAAGGSLMYFKNPGDQICEYRDSVVVDGETRSGFFRKSASGQTIPCAPELLKGDKSYNMYRNADATCRLEESGGTQQSYSSGHVGCGGPGDPCGGSINTDYIKDGVCLDNIDGLCPCQADGQTVCFVSKGMTTCGYQGWVGQCEATQDQCEEFVDRLATSEANREGKPYYYRANTLDKASCNGQASLVNGCVLLDQTSNLTKPYNAPYTYTLGQRQKGNGMVTPVSCDPGCSLPNPPSSCPAECLKRCVAIDNGSCTCNKTTDGNCSDTGDNLSCRQDSDCVFTVKSATGVETKNSFGHCEGNFKYGLACRDASDCNTTAGELCKSNGSQYSNAYTSKLISFSASNESNLVVKARLDRECSEWLACESESPTWDEASGKFKNLCTGFLSCKKNAVDGQPGQCVEVVHDDRKRYTKDVYAARDTGWYGNDASGFTIADAYPMSYVLPVNVVPNGCVTGTDPTMAITDNGHVKACVTSAACGAGNTCLPFEGMCRKGDEINTAAPCRQDKDCKLKDGEICSRSYLATRRFGVVFEPNKVCKDDSDCTAIKYGSDDNGTCSGGRCVWRYQSGVFAANDAASTGACRAYPEADAPFSDSTLIRGTSAPNETYGIADGYDTFGNPSAKKPDWSAANVCTKANDCECDYLRVKYGTSTERFYTYPGNSSGPVTYDGLEESKDNPYVGVFDNPGICVDGPNDGRRCDPNAAGKCASEDRECRKDSECTYKDPKNASKTIEVGPCVKACGAAEEGGRCTVWSNVAYQRGWPGFCIDQDKSLNVNGAENQFACNLWLPIEQLNGAPDFANQYKEAGFNPPKNKVALCTVAQGNDKNGSYEQVVANEVSTATGEGDEDVECTVVGTVLDVVSGGLVSITSAVATLNDSAADSVMRKSFDITDDIAVSKIAAIQVTLNDGHVVYLSPLNKFAYSGWYEDTAPETFAEGDQGGCPTAIQGECECESFVGGDGEDKTNHCIFTAGLFDNTSKLKRITVNSCYGNRTDPFGYKMSVKILRRESCEEIMVAHDAEKYDAFPSFPKTNAIFLSDRNKYQATTRPSLSPEQRKLVPLASVSPFNESETSTTGTYKIDVSGWLPVWASEKGSSYSLVGPSKDSATTDYGNPIPGESTRVSNTVAGLPMVKRGTTSFSSAQATALTDYKKLFASSWRKYAKEVPANFTGEYGNSQAGFNDLGNATSPTTVKTAPRVAAVNVANCSSSIDGLCTEETPQDSTYGGLTVNDLSVGSDVTAIGSYKATIKFYAMADPDHMPLRRVTFDYGDGSQIQNDQGWFKNHRGCKQDAALCDDRSRTCGSDDKDFSTQPQACDDRFFSYVHTYRCPRELVNPAQGSTVPLPECSDADPRYPCKQGNTCVFKPRVQIMDNWGLCNGSCPGGPGGNDSVCMNKGTTNIINYDDGKQFDPNAAMNVQATFVAANECLGMTATSSAFTKPLMKYSYKIGNGVYVPWTTYGGVIKVQAE